MQVPKILMKGWQSLRFVIAFQKKIDGIDGC